MRTRSFILLKLLVTLAFLGSAWFIVQPCLADAFTGQVGGVIDGDTIDVLHNGQAERIRLNGIDCPEKKQAYGKKAKQFTSTLAYGKEVTIQVLRKDRHGRTVGDVVLTDGTNVSRELVKAGLAWWYRQYSKDASLGVLEEDARQAKRGLWATRIPSPHGRCVSPNRAVLHWLGAISHRSRWKIPTQPPCRSSATAILTSTIDPTALATQPPRLRIE